MSPPFLSYLHPLELAACDTNMIQLLLDHGADPASLTATGLIISELDAYLSGYFYMHTLLDKADVKTSAKKMRDCIGGRMTLFQEYQENVNQAGE